MLKVMDIRSGKEVKINDVVDYGPPPKTSWFYPKTKVDYVKAKPLDSLSKLSRWWKGLPPAPEMIPSLTPDEKSKVQIPYPEEFHNSGFKVLDIKDLSWTEAWAKLQSLSDEKIFWCPLIVKFLTRHGLRVGYIPS